MSPIASSSRGTLSHNDYYAVNLQDGSRKKLVEKSRFAATLSPGGTYLLSFNADDSQWYSVRVSDGVKTNLTAKLGVRFDDESSDTPEPARAYGSAGWTSGDRSVLLYDKYDIWEVRPDGTDARLVTGGAGRKAQIVFRYVRTDPEERTIPTDKPFLLSAVNDVTKATGYYRVTPAAAAAAPAAKPAKGKTAAPAPAALAAGYGEPAQLVMLDKRLASPGAGGGPEAAGPAAVAARRSSSRRTPRAPSSSPRSRFEEFPNLWTAGPNFENLTKVSDANPQQAAVHLGPLGAHRVHQRRRQEAPGDPDEARELRSREEVSVDGVHLRGADQRAALVRHAVAGHEHQPRPLRQQRLHPSPAGHRLHHGLPG